MADIIKSYKQHLPALRFIGKKYGDQDRVDGNFGAKWGEWFTNGWFKVLEKNAGNAAGMKETPETLKKEPFEDSGAYIGLMRHKEGEDFQYWIGIFTPAETKVPEGFDYVDFPESDIGICWVYGKEYDVYMKEHMCAEKLIENGYTIKNDEHGACWFFERYTCPRFTTPDEKGNIVLDICFFI